MPPLTTILAAGPYNVLFTLAIAATAAAFYVAGRRREWHPCVVAALIAAMVVGGMVGARTLFFDGHVPEQGEKTILGALAAGGLALALAGRWLGVGWAATDLAAPLVPLGMAIGRIGCFLAGCCFGTPTSLPWGVRYQPGSEPYAWQLTQGLIDAGARSTVPVHPAQLYEAALDVLLAACLWRWRRRFARDGSLGIAAAIGFAGIRALTELVRVGVPTAIGLTVIQCVMLTIVLVLTMLLVARERTAVIRPGSRGRAPRQQASPVVVAMATAVAVGVSSSLTPLERAVVLLAVATTGAVVVRAMVIAHRWRRPVPAAAMAAMLALPQSPQSADTMRQTYATVGGGFATGAYVESCGPPHRYGSVGMSVGIRHQSTRTDGLGVRGQLFVGTDRALPEPERLRDPFYLPGGSSKVQAIRGGSLIGGGDLHYVGLEVGASVGDLVLDGGREKVLPIVALRLGSLQSFFVHGRFGGAEPGGAPRDMAELGVGFGVDKGRSQLRLGLGDAGFSVGGTVNLRSGTEILPVVVFGDANTYHVGLAFRQRIMIGKK